MQDKKPIIQVPDKISFKDLLTKQQLVALITVFVVLVTWGTYLFYSPNYYPGQSPVTIEVHKGQTFNQLLDTLSQKQIVPNKLIMRIAGFVYGAETKIKAGKYRIPNGLSYLDLLELFISGEAEFKVPVKLYDGITPNAIARVLDAKGICDYDETVALYKNKDFHKAIGFNKNSLEGYLLPDTYFFYKGSSPRSVISDIYHNFNKFYKANIEDRLDEIGYSLNEVLTLASIVEGETNSKDEMPIIAGVYYNRLRIGMKLQADPTLQYVLEGGWRRLLYKDLQIDSPYNTYKYYGLPPGPINNPGKDAILAALFPKEHKYLYFVADPDGGHSFSKTYREHLRKARKYQQWLNKLQRERRRN